MRCDVIGSPVPFWVRRYVRRCTGKVSSITKHEAAGAKDFRAAPFCEPYSAKKAYIYISNHDVLEPKQLRD